MSEALGYTKVKKSRKTHNCFWCGQKIERGQPYSHWCWDDDGDKERIKVHPECEDAWNETSRREGGQYCTMPYDHERGVPA